LLWFVRVAFSGGKRPGPEIKCLATSIYVYPVGKRRDASLVFHRGHVIDQLGLAGKDS